MSWNDIDKKSGGSIGGRIVQFEDATPVRIRILDEEPFTTRVHKLTQNVTKGGKTEEVFRTITATESPDDSFILKNNGKRYPEQQMFNMRGFVFKDADRNNLDGEFKVLQGGKGIFQELRTLYQQNGHLSQFDVVITRTGTKRDTKYSVSAAPFSKSVNVAELTAKLQADESFKWENLFTPITGDEQKKIIEQAGFNIMYDPAAELVASMSWDEASKTKFTFGKYKDKPLSEIVVIDAGYVEWAADNVVSNDVVAAACRVAVQYMARVDAGQAPVQIPATPAPKPTTAPAPAQPTANKAALIEEIGGYFEADPRFEDMAVTVELVKRHTGGKTRLRDATEVQLTAILAEVKNNG